MCAEVRMIHAAAVVSYAEVGMTPLEMGVMCAGVRMVCAAVGMAPLEMAAACVMV